MYHFTITICGSGKTKDEAWKDACESFQMDWGDMPEDDMIEYEEVEGEQD